MPPFYCSMRPCVNVGEEGVESKTVCGIGLGRKFRPTREKVAG